MRQKKNWLAIISVVSMAVGLSACGTGTSETASQQSTEETSQADSTASENNEASDAAVTPATLEEMEACVTEFKKTDYYQEIEDATEVTLLEDHIETSKDGITMEDGVVSITKAGTYVLCGTLNGHIEVNVGDEDKVRIVLNGVTITSDDYSAIYVANADKLIISLQEGTINEISDGETYDYEEKEEDADAAIFSHADLSFNGTGTLTINGNYANAVTTKDDLKFAEGTYVINAVGVGLKGKDSVSILDGDYTITSGKDGIKSTKTSDSQDSLKGYVYIADGSFVIESGEDGISAETILNILDGDYTITTAGGSENGNIHTQDMPGGGGFGGGHGMRDFSSNAARSKENTDSGNAADANADTTGKSADANADTNTLNVDASNVNTLDTQKSTDVSETSTEGMQMPEDGEFPEGMQMPQEGMQPPTDDNFEGGQQDSDTTESVSRKGLKAGTGLLVQNGTFNMDAADDALHCNGNVVVKDGTFQIETGDDGMHADYTLYLYDGTISITKSYEGLEGKDIIIEGGDIHVTASDDGMNAADSTDSSSQSFDATFDVQDASIVIHAGTVHISAEGDGIDSNGNVIQDGGYVIVDGPQGDGDGALDYNGTYTFEGGTLIACGSSGMYQAISEDCSTAYAITVGGDFEAGEEIVVTDESGEVILSYTLQKDATALCIASEQFSLNETVSVSVGGTLVEEKELSQILTTMGEEIHSMEGGKGGGMRGGFSMDRKGGREDTAETIETADAANNAQPQDANTTETTAN